MNGSTIWRKLACLTLTIWLAQPAFGGKSLDETFDVLKTRTGTYTNVTVTSRADNYIFIVHANGMTSIKVQDLSLDAQRKLGYAVTPPPETVTNQPAAAPAKPLIGGEQKTAAAATEKPARTIRWGIVIAVGAAGLLLHLFISYCGLLVCFKTRTPSGALIWLPVLQFIPLFRAADMSAWWVLILPVSYFMWSFKIAAACNQGIGMAISLIIPLVNVFTFASLAFAPENKAAAPGKIKATPLQCQTPSSPQPPPLPPQARAQTRPQSA